MKMCISSRITCSQSCCSLRMIHSITGMGVTGCLSAAAHNITLLTDTCCTYHIASSCANTVEGLFISLSNLTNRVTCFWPPLPIFLSCCIFITLLPIFCWYMYKYLVTLVFNFKMAAYSHPLSEFLRVKKKAWNIFCNMPPFIATQRDLLFYQNTTILHDTVVIGLLFGPNIWSPLHCMWRRVEEDPGQDSSLYHRSKAPVPDGTTTGDCHLCPVC